jgi:hypothetical protein
MFQINTSGTKACIPATKDRPLLFVYLSPLSISRLPPQHYPPLSFTASHISVSLSLSISLQDICQSGRRTRPSAGAVIGQRGRPTRTMRVAVRSSWGQNLYRRRRGAELDRGLWQERRPTCGRNSGQRCSLGAVARERSTQEARALH